MDLNEEYNDIISQLSFNQGYFYVRHKGLQDEEYNPSKKLLVYSKKHTITFQNLLEIYVEEFDMKKSIDIIYFQLEQKNNIPFDMTLEQLKKKLRRDNLDGINLFAYQSNITFFNQCSCQKYFYNEQQHNSNSIDVKFSLPNINHPLYLPIKPIKAIKNGDKNTKLIKEQLKTQIQRVFAVNTEINNIKLFINDQKTLKKRQAYMNDIESIIDLNTQIYVQFQDDLILKEPPTQNINYIVIKDTSKKEVMSKTRKYDQIKYKKVIDILKQFQPRDDWENYGLLIGDIALRPNQIFENSTKNLFKNSTKHSKHIAALIVLEEHIFQIQTKKYAEKNQLIDLNKVVAQNPEDQNLIQVCEDIIRNSQIQIQKTREKKLKIGSIYYFTTQLKVASSNNKKEKLYKTVNQMLRSMKFCQVTPDQYQKWQFNYISHLYHDLKNMSCYNEENPIWSPDPLWRGINVRLLYKKGQIITFKQFTSFSMEKQQALKFGQKTILKLTKSQSGRPIKQYSHTQHEKQILFLSYSRFQVVNIDPSTNTYQIIQVSRVEMPQMKFIIMFWVDDNAAEAKMYWQNFQQIQKSIILIQFLNNQQLVKWFEQNKQIVEDQSIEMAMISDMSRDQNGVINKKAGVQSAQILRKHRPFSQILFFVGKVNEALKHLAQKNLQKDQKIQVSDDQVAIYAFVYKIAGLN